MYERASKGWTKHFDFIVLDCLCLALSLLLATVIRHGFVNLFDHPLYVNLLIMAVMINFALILILNSYKNVLKRGHYREFVCVVKQSVVLILCITTYMFMTQAGDRYSRIVVFLTILFYGVLTYPVRLLWKWHLHKKMEDGCGNTLLLLTSEEDAPSLIREIKTNNYASHRIIGVVVSEPEPVEQTIEGVPIVATGDTMIEYVTHNWVDEVLVSVKSLEPLPEEIIDALTAMGVTVHISLNKSTQRAGVKQTISNIGGLLVITASINYMSRRQALAKRVLDICGGLAGCFITGVLYLFLAPMIKRESPGPVFFSQTRIGQNGKPFAFYKFRSMYTDAEERKTALLAQNRVKDGMMFKLDFDPRIIGNRIDENGKQVTGIGEFIRKYSLDEFPQFYNVLKGDMSIVGTRPPLPDEYEKYQPHHKARLAAKPGITGLWQVSGRSNVLNFEEVVRLDTQYINNWSVGLDIKLLLKTVAVVLRKEGSM